MKRHYTYWRAGQPRRIWVRAGCLASADLIMGWMGFTRHPLLP